MIARPSATTLARVLMGLGRSEATGTLGIRASGSCCELVLDDGRIVAGSVGSRPWADAREVVQGLVELGASEGLSLRFASGRPAVCRLLPEPVQAGRLALDLGRWSVRGLDSDVVRAELGEGSYRLTAPGESLVGSLLLDAEERAAVFWLRRGVDADEVLALPGCGLGSLRFVYALKLLRAASPSGGGAYPLMLRKHREVRANAPPHALLDLPAEAKGKDARRALRRLVRDLHPDRFSSGAPARLLRASGQIVTALVSAEARVSARRPS
ncbi:MAG: hypothetical protein AAF500_12085 [Myxococcota bacterium]